MQCPYCKSQIPDGALVCMVCRNPIPQPTLPFMPQATHTGPSKFDLAIIEYTSQGWTVTGREKTIATLRKPKPVNWGAVVAIVLIAFLLTPFTLGFSLLLGVGVYFIFFYGKYDTVVLKVDDDGEVRPSAGIKIPIGTVQPHDESTPRRTIIITIVVLIALVLLIVGVYFVSRALIADVANNANGIVDQICGPLYKFIP